MHSSPITCAEDLRHIEARPYRDFMAFDQVYDALAEAARRHGPRPALTALATADDPTPRTWTHAQLIADIRRAGRLFRRLAGAETPRVALLLPPLPEAWLALWGAEAVGTACPINHALAPEHLAELIHATGANLVLTLAPGHVAGDIGSRVLGLLPGCPGVRRVLTVGAGTPPGALDFNTACADEDSAAAGFTPAPGHGHTAALFHTGGTTGLPKLAQHSHANQLHAAWGAAQMYAATPEDVILNGFPLFHVAGSFVYGLALLLSGAQLVLPPPLGWRDPAFVARAWALVRQHRISLLATVPTVMSALLAAPRDEGDARHVRLLLTGGSPLPDELAARFEAQTGIPVRNILGMTECAGVIAIEPAAAPRTPGSCGLPLPFTQVAVVHGVLRVRGPHVGPGYTDAGRNAGSFEDGWLITGDIGHVDEQGRVFVTGRAKDLIIRGAHNIDPGVIEAALLQHPQVQQAAAVGEPDEYAGELPVAFVVAQPGTALDEAALLAFVATRVPERAASPKRITVLPALPLTAIGKVYKPALRALALQRVVQERLATAGLAARVQAQGVDDNGRLRVVFTPVSGEDSTTLVAPLQALMGGFAVPHDLVAAA